MKVNIDLNENHSETSITIHTKNWTKELEELMNYIQQQKPQRLFGIEGDQTILLQPEEIDYIYAENRKVFAVIQEKHLEIRMKLYEVEHLLSEKHFMRFSKSVIGNIQQIQRFEVSFSGNLCAYFHSKNKEYISRKYINSIKERLAMGGTNNVD
ncbi:MAG TPA: LytTR family DNA-binding domain-containing protein [Virgibacillus sp.]|nr:LytTR family DNA-binding domain-containing protein [Virgibacillus sp.]HLR66916.1 LytTR family DNA-binding domain-containing protein [Virgibacillus sp.]